MRSWLLFYLQAFTQQYIFLQGIFSLLDLSYETSMFHQTKSMNQKVDSPKLINESI